MFISFSRLCMFAAGPVFASGLFFMQPQMEALAALEGAGSFLKSLALEPNSWSMGHILLLAGALFYLCAGIGAGAIVARKNQWAGGLISLLFMIGAAGLVGNFALDFVYGALAAGLNADAAQAARRAILSEPLTQMLFAQGGPMVFLLAMAVLALTALITGWAPRLTGLLIVIGWAVVIGLHGVIPYAEAVGHFIIGTGFWMIALAKSVD